MAKAESILNPIGTVIVISQIPEFEPRKADDYIIVPATHTTCELLAATLRSGVALMEAQTTLFQINHARIIEASVCL